MRTKLPGALAQESICVAVQATVRDSSRRTTRTGSLKIALGWAVPDIVAVEQTSVGLGSPSAGRTTHLAHRHQSSSEE